MSDKSSSENFASLFEAEAREQRPQKKKKGPALGDRVRAEVVQVGKDAVFVELLDQGIGKRPSAYFDLLDLRTPDGQMPLKAGDVVEAVVVEANATGELRLGRSMGRVAGLEQIESAHAAGVPVEGKVTGVNKGGLEVEVGGVRAFCPMSQADRGYLADPQSLIGRSLLFVVTEVREGGKRVVVSRRAVLEQEAKAAHESTLAKLEVGAVLRGTVTGVREFGAFVDLGGVEGLLPNSELSYDRSSKASDSLTAGNVVEVQIREIKEGPLDKRGQKTTKITLSLKALSADPWEMIDTIAPVGKVLQGSVARLADFGAFIRLASGVDGLLHVSELGGKVEHPSSVLKVGDTLTVVVRSVDRATRKISLSPAPEGLAVGAEAIGPSIGLGSIVTGTVDRIEPFGVFLQIEGTRGRVGRGLIPNVELGTPRGADNRKLFPMGTKITAKVLETGEGRMRLSIRAVKDDEERADFDGFREREAAPARLGTFGDLFKKK